MSRNTHHPSRSLRIPVKSYGGSRWSRVESTMVGEFFVDADRTIELGRQKATLYRPPPSEDVNFDLNVGFENWTDWTDGHSERLDIIQKWFMRMSAEGQNLTEILKDAKVVIGRGILRRIASSPHLDATWRVNVEKRNGILFIYADNEECDFKKIPALTVYHGICFENYVTGGNECNPDTMPSTKSCELFRTVCRLGISVNRKKFNVLVTGEIDALDADGHYVELKVANEAAGDLLTYPKCIKSWLQCTLAGVKKVVVGYKDQEGIVRKVKEFKSDDLVSKMCKSGPIKTQDNFLFLHKLIDDVDGYLQEGQTCNVSFAAHDTHAILTPTSEAESALSEEFSKLLNDIVKP